MLKPKKSPNLLSKIVTGVSVLRGEGRAINQTS